MFARLRRVASFYERVQLPDITPYPHDIQHAGRVVASYPPSPAWAVRLPLWAGRRGLGVYAPSTAKRKRRKGLPDRQIVLYETGKLYASIRIQNMKKYYLITVSRDKLRYILQRFPIKTWARIDPEVVLPQLGKAVLVALLGCAPLRKTVQVDVRREEVVAQETLRLTTTLRDTLYLRNERLIVHYDTLRQTLRIEQVRPVIVKRDSVVIERPAPAPAKTETWWQRWGKGVFALGFVASILAFIAYLWLKALRIK